MVDEVKNSTGPLADQLRKKKLVRQVEPTVDDYLDDAKGVLTNAWKGVDENVIQPVKENVIDPAVNYAKEGHNKIMAGKTRETSLDEMVIGATPMLLAALTGDFETGAEFAGRGLLDWEARQYKEAQDEKKAQRKLASGSSKLQSKTATDMEGNEVFVNFNPATGQYSQGPMKQARQTELARLREDEKAKKDVLKDYSKSMGKTIGQYTDPATQTPVFYDKSDLIQKGKIDRLNKIIKGGGEYNPVQRKFMATALPQSQKLDREAMEYRMGTKSLKGLTSDNIIAQKSALKELVKRTEPGGRLSDFDVQFMTGTYSTIQDYQDTFRRWIKNGRSLGELPPRVRNELFAAMDRDLKNRREFLKNSYNKIYNSGETVGLDPSRVKSNLKPAIGIYDKAVVLENNEVVEYDMDSMDWKSLVQKIESDKKGKTDIRILGYE